MAEHVHWKKTTNPKYLGSWDFEPGEEMIVQVKDVQTEMIQNARGREDKNVLYLENGVKPLILNNTNMELIEKATGSPYMDEWVGKRLQLYTKKVSAFGDIVEAIRVREFSPR